jgi:hypothetical protein
MSSDAPDPGRYESNPDFYYPNRATHLASSPQNRAAWIRAAGGPGPGSYSPAPTPRGPEFTIGRRSRRGRTKQRAAPDIPEVNVVVDTLVIVVKSPTLDVDAAECYLRTHNELKTVLREVIVKVLSEKPLSPLTFMKNHFAEMRDSSIP